MSELLTGLLKIILKRMRIALKFIQKLLRFVMKEVLTTMKLMRKLQEEILLVNLVAFQACINSWGTYIAKKLF